MEAEWARPKAERELESVGVEGGCVEARGVDGNGAKRARKTRANDKSMV